MRTTIEISDELIRQAKKRAADQGGPLRKVIEEALRAGAAHFISKPLNVDRARKIIEWVMQVSEK